MQKIITLLVTLTLIFVLAACTAPLASTASVTTSPTSPSPSATDTTSAPMDTTGVTSLTDALAGKAELHAEASDTTWQDADVVSINLDGTSISSDDAGVEITGSTALITHAGTYNLSGTLADGQVIVNSADKAPVRLILDGVTLASSTSAPIYVQDASKVILILAEGTNNSISDAAIYTFPAADSDEPNAAIFSTSDLTITGTGALSVSGNFNDGIASKDGLIIDGGNITVTAVDDAIRGKDYLVVEDGSLSLTAGGDGLKSDNAEDATKGFIAISGGTLNLTSGNDAIQAETDVIIVGGTFDITAGGGSSMYAAADSSAKGILAAVNLTISNGTFTINAADDTLHSNGSMIIHNGTFALSSADDALHADTAISINNGTINITDSYEGIESQVITINNGNIHINASDDGINVANGVDGSGAMGPGVQPPLGGVGQPGGQRPARGGQGGMPGQAVDPSAYTAGLYLYINGGTIAINALGDGIDINGAVEMTNGTLLVSGPTNSGNAALDYDAYFNLSGGYIAAAGSSGMAMAPSEISTQSSVLINLTAMQPAGTLIHIQNSAGEDVLTFAPAKEYGSLAFTSSMLKQGETYSVFLGGTSTGAEQDGVYSGGTYSGGTQYIDFTITSSVTQVGTSGGGMPGRRP